MVIVCGLAFNAGLEWQAFKTRAIVTVLIESHVAERDELRARLRQVGDEKQALMERFAPAADKAQGAAVKAQEAVDKLDQTVDKVNRFLGDQP
jgi:SMC interacting uncharacterized protein involved in chromosome segregation